MSKRQKLPAMLTAIFVIAVAGMGAFGVSTGLPLFPQSPASVAAGTARHFWETGSIQDPKFQEYYDELIEKSRGIPQGFYAQDFFTIGTDGNLYPKHGILFTVLSSVFYGVFGDLGFWILVQAALFALLSGVYQLSQRVSSAFAAAIVLGATPLFTNFFHFSFAFNHDLFAPACVVWSLVLLPRTPLVAGLIFSLSLYIRISHLALLPMLVAAYRPLSCGRMQHYGKVLSGAVIGWAPLLVLNQMLWGAPLRGAYARLPLFGNGQVAFDASSHSFGLTFLTQGWRHRLFDDWEGLLATSPVWFLVPLMVWIAWKHPQRRLLATLLAGSCGYALLMLSFSYWESANGPRFVHPCTALLLVLAAALLERVMNPPRPEAPAAATAEASDDPAAV